MKNTEKLTKLIKLLEDFNQGNFPWIRIVEAKLEIQSEIGRFLNNPANDDESVRELLVTQYAVWQKLGSKDIPFSAVKAVSELLELQLKAYRLDG